MELDSIECAWDGRRSETRARGRYESEMWGDGKELDRTRERSTKGRSTSARLKRNRHSTTTKTQTFYPRGLTNGRDFGTSRPLKLAG